MTLRLALLTLVLAPVAMACGSSRPKHTLDCRERIQDCMDDCPLDPNMQDACFAGCRSKVACE